MNDERWEPVGPDAPPSRQDPQEAPPVAPGSDDAVERFRAGIEENLGDWTPGGHHSTWAGAELVVRPSGWAALDVPFKTLFAILFFVVPFGATGAVASGADAWKVLPFAGVLTTLQIVPIILATLAPGLRIFFTRYIIDDDGIRVTTQILSKTESRVSWPKVTAIRHHRTMIDRVIGIERIQVVAYGERGTTLNLVGLRDAAALRDATARKMRAHANAAGLLSND